MKNTLRLGTRKSLLAIAQSSWVAREIERLNPGLKVELVGIETRGDRIQDIPLQKVEGKDFFVAELDEALISGRVDLNVHSLKDLSLERPLEIAAAAIPKRENPRDALLASPRILDRISRGKPVRIGTSSPRRLQNLPSFLSRVLPKSGGRRAIIEFVEIRGNVNTRLSRVHEAESSPRALEGVILALAGLNRLHADQKARIEISRLIDPLRWMILPLKENPTAPGQGALAVECRKMDSETLAAISRLHDGETAAHVARERALLAEWGGGCHQRFGATAISHPELTELFYVRGLKESGESVDELRWRCPGLGTPSRVAPWDGSHFRARYEDLALDNTILAGAGSRSMPAVFAAHARAVRGAWSAALRECRVWVAGTASWERLAEQGIWVEGSSEGLGWASLLPTLKLGVLGLPEVRDWTVLTHESATDEWDRAGVKNVVATYRAQGQELSASDRDALTTATHLYWSSGSQFDRLGKYASKGAVHSCGPGKTLLHLRAQGLSPCVFPSAEEWRKWVKI